jgi:hypothetical protein
MNRREYIQQTSRYLGYTLLSGAVIDLLASCEQHGNQQWDPIFFSKDEAATLSAITDTICPTTKTPGANELGVPKFIDALIHDLLKKESHDFYKKGIEQVNADANTQFGKRFELCDTKQKESILIALDKASAPTALTMWGKPMEANPTPLSFYRKIKSLTLMAYFTSEKIGKQYLAYDPIPGKFEPCIPYHHEASWTE